MPALADRLRFEIMYRIGFTPWDGHPVPTRLRALVEGATALQPGRALDVGCGTGDNAIYLAKHGWDVTAVDFVKKALKRAEAKAAAAGAHVRFVTGDATRLRESGVTGPFTLVTDNGCMHGLSDGQCEAYARELDALVAPGGAMTITAFGVRPRRGPRGLDRREIERRFARGWLLVGAEIDPTMRSADQPDPLTVYQLRRA